MSVDIFEGNESLVFGWVSYFMFYSKEKNFMIEGFMKINVNSFGLE